MAEESVGDDPTFVTVLGHVRRIVSGELNMTSVVDEMLIVLNDEKGVRQGESIVRKGGVSLGCHRERVGKYGRRGYDGGRGEGWID